jgi:carboxypeptidase family protein
MPLSSIRRLLLPVTVAVVLLLLTVPAGAQTTGRVSGTVRVANGGPVAGALVTITNQQNGTSRTTRTSSAGAF